MELNERFRSLRKIVGCSLKEVADYLNSLFATKHDKSYISGVENGRIAFSLKSLSAMYEAIGGEVLILIKEPYSREYTRAMCNIAPQDAAVLRDVISNHHSAYNGNCIEQRNFITNYVNRNLKIWRKGKVYHFTINGCGYNYTCIV